MDFPANCLLTEDVNIPQKFQEMQRKKMQNKQQTSKDATAVLETIPLQS